MERQGLGVHHSKFHIGDILKSGGNYPIKGSRGSGGAAAMKKTNSTLAIVKKD